MKTYEHSNKKKGKKKQRNKVNFYRLVKLFVKHNQVKVKVQVVISKVGYACGSS